jgi:hypothetical protein
MMSAPKPVYSRREALLLALVPTALLLTTSCEQKTANVCANPDQLTEGELQLRASLAYTEASPDAAQLCRKCAFFEPQGDAPCGNCKILKGPVNRAGRCNSFSAAS